MKKSIKSWIGKSESTEIRYEYKTKRAKRTFFDYDKIVLKSIANKKSNRVTLDNFEVKADNLDLSIAAGVGLLTGMIDVLWVGEFSLTKAQTLGKNQVSQLVTRVAKFTGYKGSELEGAIKHLEKNFPNPSDKLMNEFGGPLQHHLRDFSHHFSPVGLVFSILTQFTGEAYGTDVAGNFVHLKINSSEAFGTNVEEKIFIGVVNWIFHLVSDMAGSNQFAGQGTGIPGILVSLLKEISTLPIVKELMIKYKNQDIELSKWISKLFNGTAFHYTNHKDVVRLDLRTEIGILNFAVKQSMPVIINQCLVRAFYLLTRLMKEVDSKGVKSISDLNKLEPKRFIPKNNRSLNRMLTVSSGIFTVIDTSDAVIQAALKNPLNKIAFAKQVVLRINFVGIASFAIAISNDGHYIVMDLKKSLHNFRTRLHEIRESILLKLKAKFKWRIFR
jgi:hypothetical protein